MSNGISPDHSKKNKSTSTDPERAVPWTQQGEAALRGFFSQIGELSLPRFIQSIVPSIMESAQFDPLTADMALMLEKPTDHRVGYVAIEAFLEGPCPAQDGFPALTHGQFGMRLASSTGFDFLSGMGGVERIVFEYSGRDVRLIDSKNESFRMS